MSVLRDKSEKALELWRAGASFEQIANKLGFDSAAEALDIAEKALSKSPGVSRRDIRRLELNRLDMLHMAVWAKALRGDEKAVKSVLHIQQARLKLLSTEDDELSVCDAVEETIAACTEVVPNLDAALLASTRTLGRSIDIYAKGDRTAAYLYSLVPALVANLEQLGATPEARRKVSEVVTSKLPPPEE